MNRIEELEKELDEMMIENKEKVSWHKILNGECAAAGCENNPMECEGDSYNSRRCFKHWRS